MIPSLVRDSVPLSISAQGLAPVIETADPQDRKGWLKLKLQEEVDKFKEDDDPMKLVDIYEVLRSLWAVCNPEAVDGLSDTTAFIREQQGGFEQFTILVDVHPKGRP
jgi:predicted house-cleaning noncanonical NTP pyrophosphatase (MazG superfamily)